MWVVIKFDKKNFDFFKKELKAELGCDSVLYYPKILIQKYKNNQLVKSECLKKKKHKLFGQNFSAAGYSDGCECSISPPLLETEDKGTLWTQLFINATIVEMIGIFESH